MYSNSLQMSLSLCFAIILISSSILTSQQSASAIQPPKEKLKLGLQLEDFITISSHLSYKRSTRIRILNLEIFWEHLSPKIASEVRHNCGIKYFLDSLLIVLPNPNLKNGKKIDFGHKGVNCSFSKEHASVTINLDEKSQLAIHNGRIKVMTVNSFHSKVEDEGDEEMCSLRLGGYEKFRRIFTTVVWDKDKVESENKQNTNRISREDFILTEFPQGFHQLIRIREEELDSDDFAIFNPNEGKGTRFLESKKCLETIISEKRTLEEIQNVCIFQCEDKKNEFDNQMFGKVEL